MRENDLTEASQYEPAIMPIYTRLTFDAGREKPDFILWPETVTPSDPLANPSLTREDRDPIPSVAAVIIDKSPSQNFGQRANSGSQLPIVPGFAGSLPDIPQ